MNTDTDYNLSVKSKWERLKTSWNINMLSSICFNDTFFGVLEELKQ